MSKFLHTSDLHFSSQDLPYCLQVWGEISQIASREGVDAILIAGDAFNEFADLEKTRASLVQPDGIPVVCTTGNHEYLRKPVQQSLDSFHFERIEWIHEPPFRIWMPKSGDWEVVAIPYATDYPHYRDWVIPPKNKPRVVMAHGMIPEAVGYTGPSEEEGDHVLECEMIARFKPDYVALGHIHNRRSLNTKGLNLHYSGSPRVWRRGETGERTVNLVEATPSGEWTVTPIALASAGQYRSIALPLTIHGDIPEMDLANWGFGKHDSIEIILSGIAESEQVTLERKSQLESKLLQEYRIATVNVDRVRYFKGFADHPFAKKFQSAWDAKFREATDPSERDALLYARSIGLEAIYQKIS